MTWVHRLDCRRVRSEFPFQISRRVSIVERAAVFFRVVHVYSHSQFGRMTALYCFFTRCPSRLLQWCVRCRPSWEHSILEWDVVGEAVQCTGEHIECLCSASRDAACPRAL